ncbi:MAG: type II toxin-antitoxin system HicA family toxin [Candidatus Binatia bacterium]|jgi:predicted RNA binding protein YcfA (HicA-like mRNA interferase family)
MSGRLPACTPAQVERVLRRAGFILHHTRGSHRYYWHAQRLLMVGVAYHTSNLKRGTLTGIIKQAGFTPEEFIKLLRS